MEWTLENLTAQKPDPVYLKSIDIYSRRQDRLTVGLMFPTLDGYCACGCGTKLKGRQTRWAGEGHSTLPYHYYAIIAGGTDIIRRYLFFRDEGTCAKCGKIWDDWQNEAWDADHIVEVREGGGGCTLDGYQILCNDPCHKRKTNITSSRIGNERKRQRSLF